MIKLLSSKIFIISVITLLFSIPLSLISDKIDERENYFNQAQNSVAQSWTGKQTFVGPIVVIPYRVSYRITSVDANTKKETSKVMHSWKQKYLMPDQLQINALVTVENRSKGIYKVPVYTTNIQIKGALNRKEINQVLNDLDNSDALEMKVGSPFLSVGISDPRGINSSPKLNIDKQTIAFKPSSELNFNKKGIHAVLPSFNSENSHDITFDFSLDVRGMESISFLPSAMQTNVTISSLWPHPQFIGRYLPLSREITSDGYNAQWKISSFASNIEANLKDCENKNCKSFLNSGFGVKHIEVVDVYLQTERSVKYGLLYISLTFVSFFIFEILNKLSIHSIQYTLIGFAMAVFYLLLMSLSEHMLFSLAYSISTLSCIALLFFYLTFVLKSIRHASAFSVLIALLYGVLYIMISAEDFALMMGALLSFLALALVMITTRHIDWSKEVSKASQDVNAKIRI